jgi:L-lactate dehydrogenase complex protein LldE
MLFPTCLVDAFYPRVGIAVVTTLERLGCTVECPASQTCCGLPLYNNGYVDDARAVAANTLRALPGDDPVVVPSGSCAWMLRHVYPRLLPEGEAFGKRVIEFSELLDRSPEWRARCANRSVTYHPSCHLLRGLGVEAEPKRVLARIDGLSLCPMDREDHCCGFGGSFSVRYPEVSTSIVDDKIGSAERTGADTVVTTDVGCLMQIEGRLQRTARPLRVVHLAECVAESLVD